VRKRKGGREGTGDPAALPQLVMLVLEAGGGEGGGGEGGGGEGGEGRRRRLLGGGAAWLSERRGRGHVDTWKRTPFNN